MDRHTLNVRDPLDHSSASSRLWTSSKSVVDMPGNLLFNQGMETTEGHTMTTANGELAATIGRLQAVLEYEGYPGWTAERTLAEVRAIVERVAELHGWPM